MAVHQLALARRHGDEPQTQSVKEADMLACPKILFGDDANETGDAEIEDGAVRVRWQSRRCESGRCRPACLDRGERLSATLIVWSRIDGELRQRDLAYLAGIRTRDLERRVPGPILGFWSRVGARLNRLGNQLTGAQRAAVERALYDRVRPLSRVELAERNARLNARGFAEFML
jgi:hypothetical protein